MGRNRSFGRPIRIRAKDSLLREVPRDREREREHDTTEEKPELEEETCHAEHHQLAELDQVGGGGLGHSAAVVNIQSGESLSEHHCQCQPCPATLYLQVAPRALMMLFVAKFGRTK